MTGTSFEVTVIAISYGVIGAICYWLGYKKGLKVGKLIGAIFSSIEGGK